MNYFEGKTLFRMNDDEESDLVNHNEVLGGKILALYFSASWSPPCCEFSPPLIAVYQELIERKMPFEVVYLSCDKNKGEMISYLQELHVPWLYLPFGDKLISDLKEKFNIIAVPKLIVLSPSGEVITDMGRREVQDRGVVCFNSWKQASGMTDR
ncbi:Nucleoredoxin-like protein 2 [Holothuria leucospilota]|uniref:Nucleoredoxin-like protein 2 n=1 Tax=Holothuria leucospilota TaxID=206669 RepID=A0A9Q1C7K4_HOLLE|nr:Nucleoredoxin-like protein 2 [Holothuria leucospilota]